MDTGNSGAQKLNIMPADSNSAGSSDNEGIGSKASGYAGPDQGPFKCANCVHFDGQSSCDNPKVQSDPEVNGTVDAEGCCNYFRPGSMEAAATEAKLPVTGEGADKLASGAKFSRGSGGY